MSEALQKLVMDLCSPSELYRLVSALEVDGLALGQELLDDLPPYDGMSKAAWVAGIVEGLDRRGMVALAVEALAVARPLRRGELHALFPGPQAISRRIPTPSGLENPFAPFRSFVGRTEELKEVEAALRRDTSVMLIGGRRCGKTALLRQLQGTMNQRPMTLLDAARWDLNSEESLLGSLAQDLGTSKAHRRDIQAALIDGPTRIIAVDEADRLVDHPWTDNFLGWLRSLDDRELRGHVRFVWAGGPGLGEYVSKTTNGSPFSNTTERVYLRPLEEEALRALVRLLGKAVDFPSLRRHCGAHPWYWTELLKRLWEGMDEGEALDQLIEQAVPQVRVWRTQLGERGELFFRDLPADGVPEAEFKLGGAWRPFADVHRKARCLALVDVVGGRVVRGPGLYFREVGG